jgi:hypothetical protein
MFWDITRRRLVIPYGRFGQPIGPILEDQEVFLDVLALEDGTDRLSRNVGK